MDEQLPRFVVERMADGEHPIQIWRTQRTLSVEKLAKKVGISPAALIELESGCQGVDDALLGDIAAALGVPVEFLRVSAAMFGIVSGSPSAHYCRKRIDRLTCGL